MFKGSGSIPPLEFLHRSRVVGRIARKENKKSILILENLKSPWISYFPVAGFRPFAGPHRPQEE